MWDSNRDNGSISPSVPPKRLSITACRTPHETHAIDRPRKRHPIHCSPNSTEKYFGRTLSVYSVTAGHRSRSNRPSVPTDMPRDSFITYKTIKRSSVRLSLGPTLIALLKPSVAVENRSPVSFHPHQITTTFMLHAFRKRKSKIKFDCLPLSGALSQIREELIKHFP